MAILNQNKAFAFIAVLLVLVFAAAFVYIVQPIQKERDAAAEQLKAKKSELLIMQKKLEEETKVDPQMVVKLEQVRQRIPEAEYDELLLRDMRLMEVTSGIQLKSFLFQPAKPSATSAKSANSDQGTKTEKTTTLADSKYGPYLYETQVSTEFTGSYSKVYTLLREAETMNRLWHVQSLSLKPYENWDYIGINHKDRAVTAKVTFVVYHVPAMKTYFKNPLDIEHIEPKSKRNLPF